MSAITDKNNIAVILAVVISSSGYFIGNSSDVITSDKVESIEARLSDLESNIGTVDSKISDHKEIGAHPAQAEATENIEKDLEDHDERLKYLERLPP